MARIILRLEEIRSFIKNLSKKISSFDRNEGLANRNYRAIKNMSDREATSLLMLQMGCMINIYSIREIMIASPREIPSLHYLSKI
jgi:hypothetical protein